MSLISWQIVVAIMKFLPLNVPNGCVSIDIGCNNRLGSFGSSNSRHLCSNAVTQCQREPSLDFLSDHIVRVDLLSILCHSCTIELASH